VASRRLRVGLLLLLLAAVGAWGYDRVAARRERNRWDVPVRVAVVVIGGVDDAGVTALRSTLDALAAGFEGDLLRAGRPALEGPPIGFDVVGPVQPGRLPPEAAPGPSFLARALHAWNLWRATRAADAAAPGFEPLAYDVRVYLVAAPAPGGARAFAEGLGEQGGEVGVVRGSVDAADPLLAATVVAHEALHCLGASDKYDDAGHAVEPEGLADPDLVPVHPQRRAEIMAGEVPLAPGSGRLPERADEIGIGPATAVEIGWVAPAR
jgi:hypothetical protein